MASSGGENMTSWIANKRKSSSTATQISEGNRSRGDRSGKREGTRMGAENTTKQVKICLNRLWKGNPKSRS